MPRRPRSNVPGDPEPDLFASSTAEGVGKPVRRFLGWGQPLVRSVVEHLVRGWEQQGALDLTEVCVVVPTRNAGRRLREALAMHAAAFEAVVLPPLVVTPDFLTSPERLPNVAVAGRVETLLIWAGELMRLDLDQHRRLFPADPVERSFTWALKVAGDLLELRETLNENGLGLAETARLLRGSEMEPERWADLARLEQRCLQETEARRLADWQTVRRRVAAQAEPPPGVRRVVVAGVLDPSGLAIEALQGWVRSLSVEVLVFAPEATHAEAFDAWGRPIPDFWRHHLIDIPSPKGTIHVGRTPGEQAEVAVKRLSEHAHPEEVAALGVADSEVTVPLEKALKRSGMGAFDPAGKRMGTHGVLHLLRVMAQLALTRSFQSVAELLRCSDVADTVSRHVERQTGHWPSLRHLLHDLDTLAAAALPDTLEDAIELAPAALGNSETVSPVLAALDWVDGVLASLESDSFGEALTAFLGEVFESRRFRTDSPGDAVFAAIADQILVTLDALDGPAARGFPGGMDASQRLELLLRVLADQAFYSERGAGDIDLQGWLELLWEDAPHVVVTGMNDGKAPESILGHTFLPDSARRVLGLRNNDTRFARDACLMTALIESRRRGGRVDFVFGKTTAAGDPLRPSLLLLQCGKAELPKRALQLFEEPPHQADPLPWTLSWPLRPRSLAEEVSVFSKLSVTSFHAYLDCPFRFYLRHGLGMQEIDAHPAEMDARAYGNLLHGVLEAFGREPEAAAMSQPNAIRETFHQLLDQHLQARFGSRLTVPVMIQRESARQRLAWWAEIEARQRREGWRIEQAETRLSPEGDPWILEGVEIRGRIDRIERHPQLGIRLIDFKTSRLEASEKDPDKAARERHLVPLKRSEDPSGFQDWAVVGGSAEKPARWVDLQLPLYRLAMERRFPDEEIQTALVSLGRTENEVGVHAWTGLDAALLQKARHCARGVIAAIQKREFWPPAETVKYDDFAELFLGDVHKAVDQARLEGREVA